MNDFTKPMQCTGLKDQFKNKYIKELNGEITEEVFERLREEKLSKQELIKKLNIHIDQEVDHINADRLLIEYIDDEEITEAFNKLEKWYS